MLKNNKEYTFVLKRKYQDRITINPISVRKSTIHFTSLGLIFTLFISTIALGVNAARHIEFNGDATTVAASNALNSIQPKANVAEEATEPELTELTFNTGGPQETPDESNPTELEKELERIEVISDPEFLPTIWAHSGKINNEFGFRRNPFGGRSYEFHAGMDIDGQRGDEIIAPANGRIVKAAFNGGYGNVVDIDHGNGLTTRYAHMSKILVSEGDEVTRGMVIGHVGSTGRSTGPHLHYELRLNDRPINPRRFLPNDPELVSTDK